MRDRDYGQIVGPNGCTPDGAYMSRGRGFAVNVGNSQTLTPASPFDSFRGEFCEALVLTLDISLNQEVFDADGAQFSAVIASVSWGTGGASHLAQFDVGRGVQVSFPASYVQADLYLERLAGFDPQNPAASLTSAPIDPAQHAFSVRPATSIGSGDRGDGQAVTRTYPPVPVTGGAPVSFRIPPYAVRARVLTPSGALASAASIGTLAQRSGPPLAAGLVLDSRLIDSAAIGRGVPLAGGAQTVELSASGAAFAASLQFDLAL